MSAEEPRQGWTSPAGLAAIAAILAVVVSVTGMFVVNRDDDPEVTDAQDLGAIFVYGTSQPGQQRYPLVERYVASYDEDAVVGWLYDSGEGYPLAKFGPGEEIPGYVLHLAPDTQDEAMREFTRAESGLFHPVEVTTVEGVRVVAFEWIDTTDGFTRIQSWVGPEG